MNDQIYIKQPKTRSSLDKRIVARYASELSKQAEKLENSICNALYEYKLSKAEYEHLKKSNDEFLEKYFETVGTLFEEIKKLDEQISAYEGKIDEVRSGVDQITENIEYEEIIIENQDIGEGFLQKETKALYRKLAKKLHPDVSKSELSAGFGLIKKAYEERDLQALIKIERSLTAQTSDDRIKHITKLEVEYQQILEMSDDVKISRHKFINSPGYILEKKYIMAGVEGRDLITEVMNQALEQIKHKQKILSQVRAKFAYLDLKKNINKQYSGSF